MGLQSLSGAAMRPRLTTKGSNSTASTTYVTLVDVSGVGKLTFLQTRCASASPYTTSVKVTLDGSTLFDSSTASLSSSDPVQFWAATGNSSSEGVPFEGSFKKSLKIELKSNNASISHSAWWSYELE